MGRMKFHFITVGSPKLPYAKLGWDEYYKRLSRFHQLQTTRIDDKKASDEALLRAAGKAYVIALDLKGKETTSEGIAVQMDTLAVSGISEVAFIIGGPDGFGDEVRQKANSLWKLSSLTLPHDLAMVVMLEALYRGTTITAGVPYHR